MGTKSIYIIAGAAILLAGIYFLAPYDFLSFDTQDVIHEDLEKAGELKVRFNLIDPNQAPESIRALVKLGYHVMIDTPKYAQEYVHDHLSCTNCHFDGGATTGGQGNGISLAGVAAKYPRYDMKFGKVIDLQERINHCFEASMSGKPLPLDSELMLALNVYLHWISKGMPIYEEVPWLGVKAIKSSHQPDAVKGKKGYFLYCATCHGNHGEGEVVDSIHLPPVWGKESFNKNAGMNRIEILAPFILLNMPHNDPDLTSEQALDIAQFIIQQPREEADKKL